MIQTLKNLDRRWIFLIVLLSAIVPLIFPIKLPTVPGETVKSLYDALNELPDNSMVLMSFDYGPSTEVELKPAAIANLRHLWRKDIKIVGMALWPEGANQGRAAFKKVIAQLDKIGVKKVYGKDYVNLGYKAGGVVFLRGLGGGFGNFFPVDMDGTPVGKLPLMSRVRKYSDFAFVITLSAGDPGIKHHIQVVAGEYGRRVGGGVTAVSAPEMSPFLNSGQLVGLMGGLRGAAEYEALVNLPGDASQGMNIQSIVHMVIVIFIIISNVVYFADKRASGKR